MKKIVILLLISVVLLMACEDQSHKDPVDMVVDTAIEKSIADLEQVIQSIEAIHPDMYVYTEETEFKKAVTAIKSQFKDGSPLEFYKLVAPLIASLNDGKTILDPLGDYFTSAIENGGNFFPYQVVVNKGKVYVKSSYTDDQQITVDSELIKINQLKAKEVYDTLMGYTSGISVSEKEYKLTKGFHRLFYIVYGDFDQFTIETDSKVVTVAGANKKNIVLQQRPPNRTFAYQTLKEGVGIITINKFDGLAGFKRFVAATFIKLKEENIKTLIIDISDNIGGNPDFSNYILSFIMDKPFRLYGDIKAKISEEVKAQDQFMRENYSDKVGQVVSAEFNEEARPYPIETFEGEVYLLISEKTYSIASELAAAFKFYQVGTLIGRPTSSNSSSFKATYALTTNHHKIKVKIPYRYYMDASGIDIKSGISPDIEVQNNGVAYILDSLSK